MSLLLVARAAHADWPPVTPAELALNAHKIELAMVEDPANVARYLAAVGEATEVPPRLRSAAPPYWKSRVLRRQGLGEEDDGQGGGVQETA